MDRYGQENTLPPFHNLVRIGRIDKHRIVVVVVVVCLLLLVVLVLVLCSLDSLDVLYSLYPFLYSDYYYYCYCPLLHYSPCCVVFLSEMIVLNG